MTERPRIPLPATTHVAGETRHIQVNHCRMPDCENYGVPAQSQHAKPGPSAGRDPNYTVESTKRGTVPSIRCKACRDNPPIKSNAAIVAEFDRLVDIDGLLRQEETTGCRNNDCDNYGLTVAAHRRHYRKNGQVVGLGQRYQCKACGCSMLLSRPVRLHKDHRQMAADVFNPSLPSFLK